MEAIMNTDQYKQRLLAMEEELSSRMKRAGATARERLMTPPVTLATKASTANRRKSNSGK
jgi:2'-5' RNA ligase